MGFFSNFPLVRYNGSLQVNLTRRSTVSNSFKNNEAYFYKYTISEGDTPENLADRFYDDVNLAWVILDFNNIVNVFEEWPKSQYELESYIQEAYENPFAVHHYVSLEGDVIDYSTQPSWNRIPVTNYEHETEVNDAKREVNLVLPEFVNNIVAQQKDLIRGLV